MTAGLAERPNEEKDKISFPQYLIKRGILTPILESRAENIYNELHEQNKETNVGLVGIYIHLGISEKKLLKAARRFEKKGYAHKGFADNVRRFVEAGYCP